MNEKINLDITPKKDIVFKRLFGSKGNEEILKDFLESILELSEIPYQYSRQCEYVYEKYFIAYPYASDAISILKKIWYCWEELTPELKRSKINDRLKEMNRTQFYL